MLVLIRRLLLLVVGITLPLQAFTLFNVAGFGMTPFKLATAVLFAAAALQFSVSGGRGPRRDEKTGWVVAFAVTGAVSLIHGFLRGVPAASIIIESTTYYSIIIYYFLIRYVIVTTYDLETLLRALVMGGVAAALPPLLGFEETITGRYEGLVGQENLLGLNMLLIAPVAIALATASRSIGAKLGLYGAAFVAVGGLLASVSRTALVAAAAMWALWVLRSRRLDTIKYALPAIALMAGAVLMAPEAVSERISTIFDPQQRAEDTSIQARMYQLEFAGKAFVSNPVLGVGMLNFIPWSHQQAGGGVVGHNPHNGYIAVLVFQGLIGFVPYLAVLALTWRQYRESWLGVRRERRSRNADLVKLGVYALFLQIALFGALVAAFATHVHRSKIAWLLLALSPVVRHLVAERLEFLRSKQPVEAGSGSARLATSRGSAGRC